MGQELAAGKIRTSFGIHGEVKVHSFSGEFDHLSQLEKVTLRGPSIEKIMIVESSRLAGDTLIMKFQGIDSPEAAKLLAGLEIWLDRRQAAPLAKGEYYMTDLMGCRIVSSTGDKGEVTGYLEGGATELLEVRKADGSTVILPFADQYLGEVDLIEKKIELKVDWILE